MKITHDRDADALYISFKETAVKQSTVTTKMLADGIAVDYDPEGFMAGIEILDILKRVGESEALKYASFEDITADRAMLADVRDHAPTEGARNRVTMYTDGACVGNPGPGGYGVVLLSNHTRKELSGGFRRTTNNRMELLAAIEGLRALKEPCDVTLYSDSQYVVNGIQKGWARKWRSMGWMRTADEPAKNPDLWAALLSLCETHTVEFKWVRGHVGLPENERADRLAVAAAQGPDLKVDEGAQPASSGRPARPPVAGWRQRSR